MKSSHDFLDVVTGLASQIRDLHEMAVRECTPVVEAIISSRSRDVRHIEHTLDSLLSFCDYETALQLYRRLCRHYWDIDPLATAQYVHAYREMWDGEVVEP